MVRALFYGFFLVAVATLPYFSSTWLKASRDDSKDPAAEATIGANGAAGSPLERAAIQGSSAASHPRVASPEAPPLVDLAEAIRFDATTAWLFQRWPRVTAGLPDGSLQGYRVPLVSGTSEEDVAGSLTYYFNAQQVCQRITLVGTVGDPRKITTQVLGRFGLKRQTSHDPGMHLYQTRWNGKPVSELKIKAAPVVKATAPFARYDVQLVLNNWPGK